MWKLPPTEIHLNVYQMVACVQKLLYAKLQPPKSHFKDARKNEEFLFCRSLFFLNSKKNSLKIHGTFTHDTLSYAMWCRYFCAKVNFLCRKKNFHSIFLSKKLQYWPKFFLLNGAFGGRFYIYFKKFLEMWMVVKNWKPKLNLKKFKASRQNTWKWFWYICFNNIYAINSSRGE